MSVEAELTIFLSLDVEAQDGDVDDAEVKQAAQDALGHTGAIVDYVVGVTVEND